MFRNLQFSLTEGLLIKSCINISFYSAAFKKRIIINKVLKPMKRPRNFVLIICCLFIYFLIVIIGCSAPVIQITQPLPDNVKEYKTIKIYGNIPGMKNTGIYLNEGDTFSILATGSIDLQYGGPSSFKYHDVKPEDGWPFMMRIGNKPYKTPLQGKNAETLSADYSGNLYLGVRDGKVDLYGSPLQPHYYDDNYGHFKVHILIWAANDYVEMADFFKKLKESDPQNKSFNDAYHSAVQKKENFLYTSKPILTIETGGHRSYMKDVIFIHDAKYLVSASHDKTIRVWDTSTGDLVRVIRGQIGEGYGGMISSMALSPDNRFLAVGSSRPGVIRVINFRTGQVEKFIKASAQGIVDLAFSPDGHRLISGSTDKMAWIWEIQTAKALHPLAGHGERVHSVAFSHDGKRVATASWDKTIRLWDSKSGSLIKSLEGHNKPVFSIVFTPDGKHLISGSSDRTIRLWNANTGVPLGTLARHPGPVKDLKISVDGNSVIVAGGGRQKKTQSIVYSIPSGTVISTFAKTGAFIAAAITSDGNTAAVGSMDDPIIYLWDVSSGEKKQEMKGKGEVVWSVGFSKDGRSIAWGKKWEKENVFLYGPLQQAFQIRGKKDSFALGLGSDLNGDKDYLRAIASVGPWSVRT
ncbi:MAG: WD40 repeat domain-containing protein, partial [Deltaproteobacteria bacterium]|nr:WD40 repeat domain-containing protein [Deltaproteobacteria bacterium]